MPGSNNPDCFPEGILAIFHDKGKQPPADKTNDAVLCWIVVTLVFEIG